MKTLLTLALTFSLLLPPVHAQKQTDPAKEKPAATETKKPEKKKEAATEKKKEPKPVELSDSDKALLADAKKEAGALSPAQHTRLMELLNKGDARTLEAVEGIGEVRAKNIMAKRPFAKAEDAAMVDGIGIETFKHLCAAAKNGSRPAAEKPKAENPKAAEKPKAAKPAPKKD